MFIKVMCGCTNILKGADITKMLVKHVHQSNVWMYQYFERC
jgi:hypothetical protein